jgi:hypothetical protein
MTYADGHDKQRVHKFGRRMKPLTLVLWAARSATVVAFVVPKTASSVFLTPHRDATTTTTRDTPDPGTRLDAEKIPWTSDFDDFPSDNSSGNNNQDDDDALETSFRTLFASKQDKDRTAIQSRQLSLGKDLVLENFVGTLGFDEVTDWEYYYPEEDGDDRRVVQPNPFDSSQPKRTRTSSGSVVRIFRGELVGPLGALVSAQGNDKRVLVKEYTGTLALALAQAELECVAQLQSKLVDENWSKEASARSVASRLDNGRLASLVPKLKRGKFLGILGEVNLAELEDDWDPNEFYRALGVQPPKPDAIWVVSEYAGLASLQAYTSQTPQQRWASLPPAKGLFGNPIPPAPLPSWEARAKYIVNGIFQQAVMAIADLHEAGFVHRSIGRSSLLLASTTNNPQDASSVYTTTPSTLTVKLTDFGFAGPYETAAMDEEFVSRARTFGLHFRKGETSIATTNFALAEDFHALGFVGLALMLSCLAETSTSNTSAATTQSVPATDEDSLQRLLGEIFDKDVKGQFRDYVAAEDCWAKVVDLLDAQDGAGWTVLETLVLAREKAASQSAKDFDQIFNIRGLLSNPFFQQ